MSDEEIGDSEDVFDVSEIEQMTVGGDDAPIFRFDGQRFSPEDGVGSIKYDFTNPIVLSTRDLEKLKEMSERFVYYLAGHLSMFLSTEFDLQLENLSADLYKNFTSEVKAPACVSLFKIQELNGVCLLDVNSHLAVTVVDRLLGGKGSTMPEERGLTDMRMPWSMILTTLCSRNGAGNGMSSWNFIPPSSAVSPADDFSKPLLLTPWC